MFLSKVLRSIWIRDLRMEEQKGGPHKRTGSVARKFSAPRDRAEKVAKKSRLRLLDIVIEYSTNL